MKQDTSDKQPDEQATILSELLHSALQGEPGSEERFWRELVQAVHRFATAICRKKCGNKIDVHDVVQESCLTIMRKFSDSPEELQEVVDWSSWLFVLVRNKANDGLRRFQKDQDKTTSVEAPIIESDSDSATILDLIQGHGADPFEEIKTQELRDQLESFLKALEHEV